MSKKDKNATSENIENTTLHSKTTPTTDGEVFGEKKKKEKKPKKVYPKTTFKHKMKVIGCLALLGVFTGCGLGVWYFNTALRSNVDYNLNPADYYGNVDSVFSKMGVTKAEDWQIDAQSKDLTPASLSPVENVLLCEYNHYQVDSYSVIGTGNVYTIAQQTVYSEKKFDGNKHTFVSISAGMLTVSSCDVLLPNGNIQVYNGEDPTSNGATWVKNGNEISSSEFQELNGVMPNAPHPYIISDKTVQEAGDVVLDEDGNYTFTLKLKTVESVLLYYKQVQRSGALEADPTFSSIEITFTINKDWQFVKTEINENYKAIKFGFPAQCNNVLTTVYNYDCQVTLPV